MERPEEVTWRPEGRPPARATAGRFDARVGPGARAAAACALLLLAFAALSFAAVQSKSPTFDEPLNTVGAWMIRHQAEWRVHPDHPALWQYWAALPNGAGALRPDREDPRFEPMLQNYWLRYKWAADQLFKTPGVDAEAVVRRSGAMMLLAALALGGLIAIWAWQIAGPVAAVTAVAFFALDPSCLGHAPLVKNDLALAAVALFLSYSLWRLGVAITLPRVVLAALAYAAGFGVKFSALVFLPLTAALLVTRALLPTPWGSIGGRALRSRGGRLAAAATLLAGFTLLAWGGVWASYRFRFGPTENPELRLDTQFLLERMRRNHLEVIRFAGLMEGRSEDAVLDEWEPGAFLRTVLWGEERRLLPQAWLYGLVYSEEGLTRREGFLLGGHRLTGWWYYLPLAFLFKTPIATLLAIAGTALTLLTRLPGALRSVRDGPRAWMMACLLLPPLLFGLALAVSRVSMGIRHAFTLYPCIFIAIGATAAALPRLWPARGLAWAFPPALLFAGLCGETLAAFPDYVAFFNVAARPSRLQLLGDSNLDWGQDLKSLADWQRDHGDRPLYLAYFGQADPAYYGVTARILPTTYTGVPGTDVPLPGERAYVAVSATHLQQIYVRDHRLAEFYRLLRQLPPEAVLGGSIYLYVLGQ